MSFVFPPAAILTMVALGAAFTARPVSAQVGTDSATNVIVRTRPDTLTLSIADVQRLAVRQNPAFLATAQESAIARGERRQAGMLRFNPDLALQSSGAAGGTSRGPLELVLTQEIEWAGQRGLRIDAADARVLGASGIVRNAGRRTIAEGSASYCCSRT